MILRPAVGEPGGPRGRPARPLVLGAAVVATLALGTLVTPWAADPQESRRVARIGLLGRRTPAEGGPYYGAFLPPALLLRADEVVE